MKNIFDAVKHNPLWNGIKYDDFDKMFNCIEAETRRYKKSGIVILSGNTINSVGLILTGSVKIIKEDMDGNATILTELTAPELFGETFACAGIEHSPVTVQASEDCEILFINYKKIICACSSACGFHTKLIENMLKIIANKNLKLNQKIEILSKYKIREKLLVFFDMQKGMEKKFTIPYNREELARYLCVDRSAMSNELCKMRDEGLIRFHKNVFETL
jgi:CRP-like cAMP-binding protein